MSERGEIRRVVVAMDSMKGCLESLSASNALAAGIRSVLDNADVVCVPVADGGEGTADALAYRNGRFRKFSTEVIGPRGGKTGAEWYLDPASGEAFIDMASASGLGLLPEEERDPLLTTSYGVGELIMEAVGQGAKKVMLGLGGSATVDAGLGACQAMGLIIRDKDGKEMPSPFVGKMLSDVGGFDTSGMFADTASFELLLLCDVTAPFTGTDGAARVFGPQKGASEAAVEYLEAGMDNVMLRIMDHCGLDLNKKPGSGAAGGAAGGLMVFAGGEIRNGAPLLLDAIGFDAIIRKSDLIITGEGGSDRQTLMGKLPFEILKRGKRSDIPVWLVAGRIKDEESLLAAGFERIVCVNSPEIERISDTEGKNPMDPDIAVARLVASMGVVLDNER